jgi:hypothetical protein
MKVNKMEFLIKAGEFETNPEFKKVIREIEESVLRVVHPTGTSKFSLRPSTKHENGVEPIKYACIEYLVSKGWKAEVRLDLKSGLKPGKVDAVKEVDGFAPFLFEWETGNISSSHRAISKMALGLVSGNVSGGVLVVPSRDFYKHLTDRIGNFREIAPYFPMYAALKVKKGFLAVMEIEHDEISENVPFIRKGLDGMSLRRRKI